jgi:hypothetical protein
MHRAARRNVAFVAGMTVIASLASASLAVAAPDGTKVQIERSQTGEPRSSSASEGRSAPDSDTAGGENSLQSRLDAQEGSRIWSITAAAELHTAFVQSEPDDARSAPDKFYNFFYVRPQVYITPYDQLRADFGMYEHFTADPGESGLRLADFSARYTRFIPLFTGETTQSPSTPPSKGVLLKIAVSATAPTSYTSKLHGVITVPRLRVYLERAFLDDSLFLTANAFGEYYVEKYRTSAGGGANALSRYATQVTADYFFPFHKQLSVGALLSSSWTYYYGVEGVNTTPLGTVADSQFTSQPVQQIYSAEVDAEYSLPSFKGIRTSAALTYAVGDNTVLHDGVQHIYYGFYRRSTELYATLTARY